MGRRRSSFIEDMVDTVSSFPWWVGLSLAPVLFLLLNAIAGMEVATPTNLDNIGYYAGKQVWKTMALFGQYILPAACILGSFISVSKQSRRKGIYETAKQSRPKALFNLAWRDFEAMVGEFFRQQGYEVVHKGGSGPDGGVDLILKKDGEKFLVQCKQWKAYKVGVQPVRELYGVMASQGATGGFVITSGEFTDDARRFTEGLNIELVNGARLHEMIRDVQNRPQAAGAPPPTPGASARPTCPKCGEMMVRRIAKKGANAGEDFWDCSKYPQCKGLRPIESPRP